MLVRSRCVVLFYWYFTVHHTSWSGARSGLRTRVGRLMGGVDAIIAVAALNHISWAVARVGPRKHVSRFMGWAERPMKPTFHGPRPEPAHQISKLAARSGPAHDIFTFLCRPLPGPSHFQNSRPGPARPTTILRSSRPAPTRTIGP